MHDNVVGEEREGVFKSSGYMKNGGANLRVGLIEGKRPSHEMMDLLGSTFSSKLVDGVQEITTTKRF